MAFTFIPLISSAVFYASNGRTKISYLDALFMCARYVLPLSLLLGEFVDFGYNSTAP